MHRTKINFLAENQPNHEPDKNIDNNNPNRRLIFLILIVSFLLVLAGCITKVIVGKYAPTDPAAYDPITLKPKSPPNLLDKLKYYIFSQNNNLEGASKDRIDILLLGIGGVGHDGPQLTDTIIIASIKPSTDQLAMISIPRDLAVDIPGFGIKKVNNANAYGENKEPGSGPELSKKIIENTFNTSIPYYLRIDFKAFEEIINELGGVTVDVERSFTDQMYPADNSEYQTVSFEKGVQNMNGDMALKFARSRHGNNGEGSDFARAHRQQKILLALKEKILSFGTLLNPFRINNIYNSLQKHINTNLSFGDIIELARLVKNLKTKEIVNVVLDDSPKGYLKNATGLDGAFLLEPVDGNFDRINDLIANVFTEKQPTKNTTPEQAAPTYQEANVELMNGTWRAGLAARMKKRLEDKNFLISAIGNAENRPLPISGIYQISNKDFSKITSALQQELHIPIRSLPPEGVLATSTTDILVVMGDDMQE